jgi:threonine dehydratase
MAVVQPLIASRLSVARIAAAVRHIDPRFLGSPHAVEPSLSAWLGCELLLQDDSANPLGSFKGRGAHAYVATRASDTPMVCASAGNFGMALVHACRRHRVAATVFVSRHANAAKVDGIRRLGGTIRVAGEDFDAAKAAARAYADETGDCFVEDGREPAISEGAGTIGIELLRAQPGLDAVVLPLGNGALLAGVGQWIKAHAPATRVIGATVAGAPAMRQALRGGPFEARCHTIADGIAVRVPVPEAVLDLLPVLDEVLEVDDAALMAAMRMLHARTGRVAEPAAAAGLAAIAAAPAQFAGRRVATVITGRNLTREQRAWLD